MKPKAQGGIIYRGPIPGKKDSRELHIPLRGKSMAKASLSRTADLLREAADLLDTIPASMRRQTILGLSVNPEALRAEAAHLLNLSAMISEQVDP